MISKIIKKQLIDFFRAGRSISAVYLFGSRAHGNIGALSDYDLGILLNNTVKKEDFFDLKIRLINCISSILKTDALDIVILNEATVNIGMSVIKGILIFEKDENERIAFELKVMREYKDRTYYENRYSSSLVNYIHSHYG